MNGKKRNLITDTEAVSGVIGAVLLMAIAVTMFTLLQATAVPMWNKQVERAHMPVAYDDMMTLKSDIEDVATLNVTKSSDINLGARYPDRMIFRNPGPGAYGTLTVEGNVSIEIEYDGTSEIINSSRITYELYGMTPKIVYEHGILIRDYGNGVVLKPIPPDNHSLYDKAGNLYIPIVNLTSEGEDCFSTSSLDSTSLTIFPYPRTDLIEPTTPGVTITLATNYSTVWDDILVSNDYTTASVTGDRITLVNTATEQLYLPEYDEDEMYKGVLYSGIAQPYMIPSSSVSYSGIGGNLSDYVENDTTSTYVDVETAGPHTTETLEDVVLINNGDVPVIITFIRVSWVPDLAEVLKKVYLNDDLLFENQQSSGTWFDVRSYSIILYPGDTATFDFEFVKDDSVQNKDFTIDFVLNDGSMETVTFST